MLKQPTSAPVTVKSADRVLDILEAVAASGGEASFSGLMSGLGIPRSSLFQLLQNLAARGYLEQDQTTLHYRLGPGLARLMRGRPAPVLTDLVRPILQRLSRETNETAGFYVRDGDHTRAITTETGSQALGYTMRVGERAPLYAISSGKIMLSRMPDHEINAYFSRIEFESFTPHTLNAANQVWPQIRAAREEGFAYAREEFTVGITGIATAVQVGEKLIGTFNLAVPSVRFTRPNAALFRQRLAAAAAALVDALA